MLSGPFKDDASDASDSPVFVFEDARRPLLKRTHVEFRHVQQEALQPLHEEVGSD